MAAKSDDQGATPPGSSAPPPEPARREGGDVSPMFARPSRREIVKRIGMSAGVLAASAALGKLTWDHGGFGAASSTAARQVRDYRMAPGQNRPEQLAELAIAKQKEGEPEPTAEQLVRRAIEAMGGMKR
ncbi:MAG: hypothetical protein QOI41_3500, partial [Myxococcales bacterium]|nr:hypothetical protein [Myxococcales bacterium]